METYKDPFDYHQSARPGKIEVVPTKPCQTQRDLSLAYSPGVAQPCLAIEKNPDDVFKYTAKANLVAVVSNGSAVLGLGAIGALAGKPVMEGKAVLFKRFADIDVFDIELDTQDPEEIIRTVKLMEPTFGGINLEDIKAPECFLIEERLKAEMGIPVFHDDQHGTAIISGAGLLNALKLVGKKIDEVNVVFNGAGAAGVACARFYIALGVRPENIIVCDTKGVIYRGRKEGMNPYKESLAVDTDARTLAQALEGADVFSGCSVKDAVTQDMIRSMADKPIIFAMANPDPEISYPDAVAARDGVIAATGRSDFPNQINNVLGFPSIFRGALDVRATTINDAMQVAAAKALADLAREPVPYQAMKAYNLERLHFGPEYIIPKPFDPRVLVWEASAVAKAAMDTGVARLRIDLDEYRNRLEERLGITRKVMRVMINKARSDPKRIVYPEGDHPPVLKACEIIVDDGIARPVLLGQRDKIESLIAGLHIDLKDRVEIIDPAEFERLDEYVNAFHELRQRKGMTKNEARTCMKSRNYFGPMMVHMGEVDGLVSGLTRQYQYTLRPALQIIGKRAGVNRVAGMYAIVLKDRRLFFADTTVNLDPSAEDLAEIAILCAQGVTRFGIEPHIAMISFSNFGSSRNIYTDKVRRAVEIVRERAPHLKIDGEMQADTAVTPQIIRETFPFSTLDNGANVLIFPNLDAGNAAYKLVQRLSGGEAIGPILMGMRKPVHVLQLGGFDEIDVVNMTAIAVVDAQEELA